MPKYPCTITIKYLLEHLEKNVQLFRHVAVQGWSKEVLFHKLLIIAEAKWLGCWHSNHTSSVYSYPAGCILLSGQHQFSKYAHPINDLRGF